MGVLMPQARATHQPRLASKSWNTPNAIASSEKSQRYAAVSGHARSHIAIPPAMQSEPVIARAMRPLFPMFGFTSRTPWRRATRQHWWTSHQWHPARSTDGTRGLLPMLAFGRPRTSSACPWHPVPCSSVAPVARSVRPPSVPPWQGGKPCADTGSDTRSDTAFGRGARTRVALSCHARCVWCRARVAFAVL